MQFASSLFIVNFNAKVKKNKTFCFCLKNQVYRKEIIIYILLRTFFFRVLRFCFYPACIILHHAFCVRVFCIYKTAKYEINGKQMTHRIGVFDAAIQIAKAPLGETYKCKCIRCTIHLLQFKNLNKEKYEYTIAAFIVRVIKQQMLILVIHYRVAQNTLQYVPWRTNTNRQILKFEQF